MPPPVITFACPPEFEDWAPKPVPAKEHIPDWYRRLEPRITPKDNDQFPTSTAKRCMPMFDAFETGYIIPSAVAVRVVADEEGDVTFTWQDGSPKAVDMHGAEQLLDAPHRPPFFKWINPWSIMTPPGYSCLFTPVLNDFQPFTFFSAVVDTDRYHNQVNFPFTWNRPGVDTLIDAGTPLVQVVPFKRDAWTSEVRTLTEKEVNQIGSMSMGVSSILSGYKKLFRSGRRQFA